MIFKELPSLKGTSLPTIIILQQRVDKDIVAIAKQRIQGRVSFYFPRQQAAQKPYSRRIEPVIMHIFGQTCPKLRTLLDPSAIRGLCGWRYG